MQRLYRHHLEALIGSSLDEQGALAPDGQSKFGPEGALGAIRPWVDQQQILLMRALLDALEQKPRNSGKQPPLADDERLEALYRNSLHFFESLRGESQLRFLEFRDKWKSRLATSVLLPLLRRNAWLQPHPKGGFVALGKGNRKDAKMLYLQTLHDMASDAERQIAGLTGRVHAAQKDLVQQWHLAGIRDNASRLWPILESSLRDGEYETWKRLRLRLGDLAQNAFIRRVHRWENRIYPDESTLITHMAWPWYQPREVENGFLGFMRVVARLSESLVQSLIDHYDQKWTLLIQVSAGAFGPELQVPAVLKADSTLISLPQE